MKAKFLTILFVAISMFFIACDEDSITEAVLGTNSITLTGDITKSFDANSMAGLTQEDSMTVFAVVLQPEAFASYDQDVLTLFKVSDALPPVGDYELGEDIESGENFVGTYAANDTTFYFIHSGTVKITESGTSKIAGTFDMTGYPFDVDVDSSRALNITGEFSTIPADLD